MGKQILYLFKVLIYDYFDFCQAFNSFCGVQLFSVARSLCDHSRIFILCLCDKEFLEFYFSEYEDEDKKKRYYEKRESNISKKLKEIAEKAKDLNEDENFYAESSIFNLTTDLYTELTDKLGEICHMSEITLIKELIPLERKLLFSTSKEWKILKFNDNIIEYLIMTSLVTEILFISENVEISKAEKDIFNFLNWMSEELFKFRNVDKLLTKLKRQLCDIWTSDD